MHLHWWCSLACTFHQLLHLCRRSGGVLQIFQVRARFRRPHFVRSSNFAAFAVETFSLDPAIPKLAWWRTYRQHFAPEDSDLFAFDVQITQVEKSIVGPIRQAMNVIIEVLRAASCVLSVL